MHLSRSVFVSALMGLTSAQTVQVVTVSSPAGEIIFTPNNIKASVGDQIQFQYLGGNHSVTQASFDFPCTPIQQHVSNETGIFSGFMDVAALAGTGKIPTYTTTLTTASPIWLYCAQDHHCQGGMTMVINENTAANATRSLENFKALAANVPETEFPDRATVGKDSNAGLTNDVVSTIAIPSGTTPSNGTTSTPPSFVSPPSGTNSEPVQGLGSVASVSAWTGVLCALTSLALL
ncbi:hypothetical protein GGS21DRAFT_158974 [Xylaria nigripes]|nr:hypothetical protein GGS21DRAFT_158974 [Xylaria nigripes]